MSARVHRAGRRNGWAAPPPKSPKPQRWLHPPRRQRPGSPQRLHPPPRRHPATAAASPPHPAAARPRPPHPLQSRIPAKNNPGRLGERESSSTRAVNDALLRETASAAALGVASPLASLRAARSSPARPTPRQKDVLAECHTPIVATAEQGIKACGRRAPSPYLPWFPPRIAGPLLVRSWGPALPALPSGALSDDDSNVVRKRIIVISLLAWLPLLLLSVLEQTRVPRHRGSPLSARLPGPRPLPGGDAPADRCRTLGAPAHAPLVRHSSTQLVPHSAMPRVRCGDRVGPPAAELGCGRSSAGRLGLRRWHLDHLASPRGPRRVHLVRDAGFDGLTLSLAGWWFGS